MMTNVLSDLAYVFWRKHHRHSYVDFHYYGTAEQRSAVIENRIRRIDWPIQDPEYYLFGFFTFPNKVS